MEITKSFISLSVVFWLATTSASQTEEREATTEGFEFPTYETTTNVTESPDDNGMVIADVPPETTPTAPPTIPQSKEEDSTTPQQQQPGRVSFPDNHKNFTPSQYLGDEDFPPYHNRLNLYQQQYKNYNEQKEMFSRKPIKFEENDLNNYYLSGGGRKTENKRVNRTPFPYAFDRENWYRDETRDSLHLQSVHENEKAPEEWYKKPEYSYKVNEMTPEEWYKPPEQSHTIKTPEEWYKPPELPHKVKISEEWYKHTGRLSAYDKPNTEYVPYGVFAPGHPHEENFLHFNHGHLKKDEKGSAWKKVFHVLTALVPLGLILASLSPNVISINSTSAVKTSRQRSEDAPPTRFREEDVLKLMKKYGVDSLKEGQCEDRILCELAVEGNKSSAGPIEKGFWFLANETPWDIAEKAGMNDLFKAIKARKCSAYKCHGRKPTQKHKTTKQSSTSEGSGLISSHLRRTTKSPK